ncbi:hypothetical protein C0992_013193 [Termitomyces sp. T32_za158]|nr:hypothetical protein C0992_013193 [Termitomyces sp. T32_za158]
MAPTRNARMIFNSMPVGYPVPGKTTVYDTAEMIDIEKVPLNGGFVLKTLVLSVDPYLRLRMRGPDAKSSGNGMRQPFKLGESLASHGVGVVVRSENAKVKVGSHAYGLIAHQEYSVFKDLESQGLIMIENKEKLPWSVYVGVAGMSEISCGMGDTGQTAYYGWKEYSKAKNGEVAFVTAGGGSVGSLVIQLAKLDGLKVIASAGSAEKVAFMKNIGADVAFNYKTTDTAQVLEREGPIDVYWDNVGGQTLDTALEKANVGARFINLMQVVAKRITIQGFPFDDLQDKYQKEFYATIPEKLKSGKIKHKEEVTEGLDKVGEVILRVQKGENKAKAVVKVADE